MDLPSGTITLVFTDIQDSSEYSERYRADYEPVRAMHFQILRDAMARWNGHEVSTAGDALFLVFQSAADAVQWAVDAQRSLARHDWPKLRMAQLPESEVVRVAVLIRIGMHTGEPFLTHNAGRSDYFGPTVNRAARVSSAAYGGQVLVSAATHSLVRQSIPSEITFRDCGMHRLKGVGEEQLWQIEATDLIAEFPPLKTFDPNKHNLPIPSSPYLGREQEMKNWAERLLDPAVRLLTLTGFGGMGKTRSALHLAELSLDDFADGVCWVEAEEAHTGEELLQRIAASLHLPLHPEMHVRDQVSKFFRERSALLVLDNLEQVINAGRAVKELLTHAPKLKLLVTSRRALEIQEERVVEVSPLPATEAAELFVNRVRDRQPAFELNAENQADVDELCRRLDGVPLALELAASRIATLSPRQMLQRLNERFKLLQTRSPDLPDRQRALRAAIDWSYDLLSDDDKSLFTQASVFAGGFTVEDAEAVCEAFDVLEGIAELRVHSLLRSETDPGTQETRFTMFNSLREYAQEKLNEGGTGDETRLRHARYFSKFAAERLSKKRSAQEAAALLSLDTNVDNLRAAMEYAFGIHELELFARLGLALGVTTNMRGYAAEAITYVQAAVDALRPLADGHASLLGELLEELGWMSIAQESGGAEAAGCEALEVWTKLGDRVGQARTERLLGFAAMETRDYESARVYFAKALEVPPSAEAEVELANVYDLRGVLEYKDPEGDLEQAARYLREALDRRRKLQDMRGLAETLNNLGVLAYQQEDWPAATTYYLEALQHELELLNWFAVARSLYNLAEAAQAQGDLERALPLAAASERLMDIVKSPWLDDAGRLLESIAASDEGRTATIRQEARALSREHLVSWAVAVGTTEA